MTTDAYDPKVELARWRALGKSYVDFDLKAAWRQDPDRDQRYTICGAGVCLDYSRQRFDQTVLNQIATPALEHHLQCAWQAMVQGRKINQSESRAVWHVPSRSSDLTDWPDMAAIRKQMAAWVHDYRSGQRCGASGERFDTVINIGIGGSHYGPKLVLSALRPAVSDAWRYFCLDSPEGSAVQKVLSQCDPARTLCVVVSKSFSSVETTAMAEQVKAWLIDALGDAGQTHLLVVSAKAQDAADFCGDQSRVLALPVEIGGRYSLWSSAGLSIALCLGWSTYLALLAGAAKMDAHTEQSDLLNNIPAMLALFAYWNHQVLGDCSEAIIPYGVALRGLPAYLQQLHMESLGKGVTQSGDPVAGVTGAITWGDYGTRSQHTFHQYLMQAPSVAPVDFIIPQKTVMPGGLTDDERIAHALAQVETLLWGRDSDDPARVILGNKPCQILSFACLDAKNLGALLAAYEHKVYFLAILLGINAFDQWGVEHAKHVYTELMADDCAALSPAILRLQRRLISNVSD